MQDILLTSLPMLTESIEKLKTASLLEVLSCIASLTLEAVSLHQRDQVAHFMHIAAPILVQRAQATCKELQERRGEEEDKQRTALGGSSTEMAAMLDPADWMAWEGASRAYGVGKISTIEDQGMVLGVLRELGKHVRVVGPLEDPQPNNPVASLDPTLSRQDPKLESEQGVGHHGS